MKCAAHACDVLPINFPNWMCSG